MKMIQKIGLIPAIALLIIACGDDSSSSNNQEKKIEADMEVDAFDELPSCAEKRQGKTAYVVDQKRGYVCSGGKWVDVEGVLIDERDGKTYKVVKIGDQVWMAENLNYDDSVATPDLKGNSWCYEEKAENCAASGRLYAWVAAKEACPSGWHLPTNDEFKTLIAYVGDKYTAGKYLKSQNGWDHDGNGTDDYGFSALPAGSWNPPIVIDGDTLIYSYSDGYGEHIAFWSAIESVSGGVFAMVLDCYEDYARISRHDKSSGFSVRCVQGLPPQSSSSARIESSSSEAWDWSVPKESYFNPNVKYGTMTDERDGKVYKTVKIGDQVWMAENLNYADSVKTPSLIGRSTCYDDDPDNCNITGRMYSWVATIDSVALATDAENPRECGPGNYCELEGIQGICPVGWHLPSRDEWETLIETAGGIYLAGDPLKSRSGWFSYEMEDEDAIASGNGTDDYGFSLLPAGNYGTSAGPKENGFSGIGFRANLWNSNWSIVGVSLYGVVGVDGRIEFCRVDERERLTCNDSFRFSVRCVKDN